MKDRIEETIIQFDQKVLAVIGFLSGAFTWMEFLDAASKVVLFLISAGAGVLAIINYVLKNRKLRKENELLDQQIAEQIEKNLKGSKGYAGEKEDWL